MMNTFICNQLTGNIRFILKNTLIFMHINELNCYTCRFLKVILISSLHELANTRFIGQ